MPSCCLCCRLPAEPSYCACLHICLVQYHWALPSGGALQKFFRKVLSVCSPFLAALSCMPLLLTVLRWQASQTAPATVRGPLSNFLPGGYHSHSSFLAAQWVPLLRHAACGGLGLHAGRRLRLRLGSGRGAARAACHVLCRHTHCEMPL